ncbi:MAG: hypothetical protein LAO76_26575 [Acidobacteriia bacterium]|nr:hypothetical protein [Terriglobia bacterium]
MKLRAIMIAIGLAMLCHHYTLVAQVPDDYLERIGIPDFSVNDPVEMGAINVANGSLHLDIPLASLAQRGKAPFNLKLVYDSQLYGIPFGNVWRPNAMIDSLGGWRVITSDREDIGSGCFLFGGFPDGPCPGINYGVSETQCTIAPGGITDKYFTFSNFSYLSPDGLSKTFPIFTYNSPSPSLDCIPDAPNGSAYADDGSGYFMSVTGYTQAVVYDNYGNIVSTGEDSNGNIYGHNANGVVDFVGRNPVLKTVQGNLIYLDVLNSQGTRSRYTITTTTINVHTAFGPSFMTEYQGSLSVIQSVRLPNNTLYQFDYDSGTASGNYGLLKSITLPGGAVVQYTYTTFVDSQCSRSRWVSSRTSEGNVWSYTPLLVTSRFSSCPIPTPPTEVDGVHQVTAVMPDHSSIVYIFTVRDQSAAWMTSSISRDPAGNTLQTVTKDYDFLSTARLFPIRVTTSLPFNGSTLSKKTEYSWSIPNLTEVREWDFYTGTAPATATRVTDATYTSDNPADVTVNILSKPTAITISDGAGHIAGKGVFEYDNYTDGLSLSGAVQHDAVFSTAYTTRGNLTAVSRLLTSDGSFLVTRNQYDDAGNITSTTDPGLHKTTFSYTDAWGNAICAPSSGNSAAYVTKVTNAKSQFSSSTYNSCTGKLASSTDLNNNTTNFSYADSSGNAEPLDRLLQTQFPPDDSGVRGKITKSYNEASLPLTFTTTRSITSTQDLIDIDKLDDLGRTVQKAITSDPQGTVYSPISYDFLNRKSKVNNPTRCNPPDTNCGESTWGFASYLYDILNRPTTITSQDGGTTRYSYNGNSVTVTDEAGKPRRTVTDGLGRLIEVDEPGGAGSSGVQATASVSISGAFSSTWVAAGSPHLAATGTALASVTLSDGSSHTFYFDTNQHLCQMSWNSSSWFDQDLTSMSEAGLPLAGSSIAAVALGSVIHVFYQGANQHIYDMNWTGSVWQNLDMTVLTGASPVSNTKMAIVDTGSSNTPMMFYEGANQHLFCVYWYAPTTTWSNADLHSLSGATNLMAPNGSISAAMWGTTGNIHALFLDTNQNLNRIVWSGTAWITNNLTSMTGAAVAAAGSKLTTIATGTPIDLMTFYEGAGQHIYSIYWNNSAVQAVFMDLLLFLLRYINIQEAAARTLATWSQGTAAIRSYCLPFAWRSHSLFETAKIQPSCG